MIFSKAFKKIENQIEKGKSFTNDNSVMKFHSLMNVTLSIIFLIVQKFTLVKLVNITL